MKRIWGRRKKGTRTEVNSTREAMMVSVFERERERKTFDSHTSIWNSVPSVSHLLAATTWRLAFDNKYPES